MTADCDALSENYGEARERTDWYSVALLFVAGIAAAVHFAKVPPVLPSLSAELGLSPIGGGLAVSLVALMGVVLGVAAGALVDAWGRRRLLTVSLIAGGVTSALVPVLSSTSAFLGLRVFEGLSHLVIVVAAPSLMGVVARPSDRTLVMTVWGSFFAVGFALTDLVAPALVDGWGWRSLFWAHAVLFAVVTVLLVPRLNRLAREQTLEPPPSGARAKVLLRTVITDHGRLYRHGPIMLATAAFVCHCLMFSSYLSYVRAPLVSGGAVSADGLGPWMSLLAVLSIVATTLVGAVLLRLGVSPFTTLTVSFAGEALAAVAVFAWLDGGALLVGSVVLFLFSGCVQGATFATIPLVASDRMAALAHGAFAQGGNVGTFLGPPLYACVGASLGWGAVGVVSLVICVLGAGFAVLTVVVVRRVGRTG
ncbi:putative MFS family arabinose efflux permease [Herbihabitans rhizosphaerae]|uniref:Putative MFS family arabinose efflux permease n=1 Tax=Herbihabitans rhizosphaerae TaxID=1872711 RepID=A0A4Q7KNQ4_9PSEU|nr:MFS transporter [Herbihabitans rhizosphaerae]RZS36862.1 putative MFS family arabinose efflux permease [Herbihabitans rhizosphaerae]